jgi:predicted house-cleaning noncanonical NTP pyrophosphatase (MazG superfamily)
MKKLIRDNIPKIIEKSGRTPNVSVCAEAGELSQFVRVKLQEELDEVLSAKSRDEQVEELADLLEVARKFAQINGISWDEVTTTRATKALTKGAFEKNYILEFAGKDENGKCK